MRVAVFAFVSGALLMQGQVGPEQALWKELKKHLSSAGGEQYFTENLKDSALPPLAGSVATATVNEGVSRVTVRMEEGTPAEVELIVHHLDWRISREPKVDDPVKFTGVGRAFRKDPLTLTLDVERSNIEGIEFRRTR